MARGIKKITSGEGISLGDQNNLEVSIGTLIGKQTTKSEKNIDTVQNAAEKRDEFSRRTEDSMQKVGKIILQRQKTGRGGKVVTAVIFAKGSAVNLEYLAKEMRKGLGCGSHVEEDIVILQGDISDRAEKWLKGKGVKIIIRGN